MGLARIARQRVWHMLPLWALAAGVNTSVLLGVFSWRAAIETRSISVLTLTLVGWVGVATYLAFTDLRTRCTHFELSLPVTSRSLWLNNLMATLAGGLMMVGLTLGVIALHSALRSRVHVGPDLRLVAVVLCTGLALATLLLQAPRPSLARIPAMPLQIVWTVVVLAGTPLLLAVAAIAGWPGLTLLLSLTAVVAFRSYSSVPRSYSLVPLEPQSAERADSRPVPSAGARSSWLVPLTIARAVSAGAKELMAVPLVLLFSMMLGGALLALESGSIRELRFLYLPMTTYILFALIGPRLCALHYIDALPIPRRSLVAALVLPYFLLMCAGYGVGAIIARDERSRLEYVNFEEGDDGYRVTVPLRVYATAWDGQPPPVDSPWGESHASEALAPFGWSRAAVYSPYSAPPGSSARFVAQQISRAANAVYGASIPPETIERRYLVTRADGSVAVQEQGLTLRRDYPTLKARSGPMFPALVALGAVPWLLLVALLLRAYRSGIGEWVRQTIVWGSLVVLMGCRSVTVPADGDPDQTLAIHSDPYGSGLIRVRNTA